MLALIKQTMSSYLEVTKISESSLLTQKNRFTLTHGIGENSTLTDLSTISEGKAKSGKITQLWRKGEFKMIKGEGLLNWGTESRQKCEYNTLELMDTVEVTPEINTVLLDN